MFPLSQSPKLHQKPHWDTKTASVVVLNIDMAQGLSTTAGVFNEGLFR